MEEAVINDNLSSTFSRAECIFYACHALGKENKEYFSFKDDPNKSMDFRRRLFNLSSGSRG